MSQIRTVFFDIGNTLVKDKKWLPNVRDLISHLRKKGTDIGIISNTGDLDRDQLSDLLPEDFEFANFDESLVMLSSETGISKPKLDAFLLAVQHSGKSPWECCFIGESLNETFMAQKAGMLAIRVCGPDDFKTVRQLI